MTTGLSLWTLCFGLVFNAGPKNMIDLKHRSRSKVTTLLHVILPSGAGPASRHPSFSSLTGESIQKEYPEACELSTQSLLPGRCVWRSGSRRRWCRRQTCRRRRAAPQHRPQPTKALEEKTGSSSVWGRFFRTGQESKLSGGGPVGQHSSRTFASYAVDAE